MYEVHASAFNFYYIHLAGLFQLVVPGRFFSHLLGGSMTLELLGMFSGLVFYMERQSPVLNSVNPRMTK